MSVIFSDFLLPNEMPWYTEHISTTIFFICVLFLSYQPVKVSRNNMDHPVYRVVFDVRITIYTIICQDLQISILSTLHNCHN